MIERAIQVLKERNPFKPGAIVSVIVQWRVESRAPRTAR
jgi:hypothetical protein